MQADGALRDPLSVLRRHLGRVTCAVAVLVLLYLLTLAACGALPCGSDAHDAVNLSGQLALLAAVAGLTLATMRADPVAVWTPALVYPASVALFFGFGNLSFFLANERTVAHAQNSVYRLSAEALTEANLLTMLGALTAVIAMRIALGRPKPDRTAPPESGPSVPLVAIGFLTAGLGLKYGVILPAEFATPARTMPGAIRNLSMLADLGFALATYQAAQGRRVWALVFWLLWPPYLALGALEFSKKVVILAILLPALGAYLGHRDIRRLTLWGVFAALIFMILQPLNTQGRAIIEARAGDISRASLIERMDVAREVLGGGPRREQLAPAHLDDVQVWWLRLNYAGVQAKAMERYDAGQPGEAPQSPLVYFIPRILWPDKPTLTNPGIAFHRSVIGNPRSETRVGMSVYADGYWRMGWPGVVLFSGAMGAIFGVMTRLSHRHLREMNFLYLPATLLALGTAAQGHTGYLQNSILGALPVYLGYLGLIWIARRLFWPAPSPILARTPC